MKVEASRPREEHDRGVASTGATAPEVKSWSLVCTLGTTGAAAGLLIVLVFHATQPSILAHREETLRQAIQEVLNGPSRWETLYVHAGALTPDPPADADLRQLEKVFVGFREDGNRAGFAITGAEPGFQDIIELIFGYDAEAGRVIGMKVLANRETPGLGDKIVKDEAFVGEFEGPEAPLNGVKAGRSQGAPNEIDMITGATISSRAVIAIINHRLEALIPLLRRYLEETP